jgi:hypothetical protein
MNVFETNQPFPVSSKIYRDQHFRPLRRELNHFLKVRESLLVDFWIPNSIRFQDSKTVVSFMAPLFEKSFHGNHYFSEINSENQKQILFRKQTFPDIKSNIEQILFRKQMSAITLTITFRGPNTFRKYKCSNYILK